MHDAFKALDKDGSGSGSGSVRKQLADKDKFVRVEHTPPGERSLMIYVNTKFKGNLKDLPMP